MNIARMWRGFLCFAVVVAAFVSWLGPPEPRVRYAAVDQSRAKEGNQGTALPGQKTINPSLDKKPCGYGPENGQQDVCANWKQADWEEAGVLVAIFGTLALLIQIGFTWRALDQGSKAANAATLSAKHAEGALEEARRENARAARRALAGRKETTQALTAANKSAEAAAGQVEIARDTAYRQLRAYISLELQILRVSEASIKGQIRIKNAGNTPAIIDLHLAQWIGPHPLTNSLPAEAPEPFRYKFHGPFVNARSEEYVDWFYPLAVHYTEEFAKEEIARALADPLVVLYAYGRVEFVDFKKRRRILHFTYRNHGRLALGAPCEMIACVFGNYYEDKGEEA